MDFNGGFREVEAVDFAIEPVRKSCEQALESFADMGIPVRGGPSTGDEVMLAIAAVTLLYAAVAVDRFVEIVRDRVPGWTEGAVLDLDPEILALGASLVQVAFNGGEIVLVHLRLEGFPGIKTLDTVYLGPLQEREGLVGDVAVIQPLLQGTVRSAGIDGMDHR